MRHVDSAGRKAHEVVGLYGDPDTTWGICLELGLAAPLVPHDAATRLAVLVQEHPHLGTTPTVRQVAGEAWDAARAETAGTPYREGEPLVRVLVDDQGRVLVAAHHGVCDGLGLVAIASAACGTRITPTARGIGDRAAPHSFWRGSVGRLVEALLRPPPRFVSHVVAPAPEEHLRVRSGPLVRAGSADLAMAVARVFTDWNPPARGFAGKPLFIAGASRRVPGALAPDRQTGYLRFRVEPDWSRDQVRAAFGQVDPEPEFPETSAAGIGPRITRMLRGRLGGSAQISNLGVLDAPGVRYAAMFPALSGPRAVALGMVTTAESTTLSVRTRGSEFSASDTDELLDRIWAALPRTQ